MRLLTHIVSPEQEGWPLRRLLRNNLRNSPRNKLRKPLHPAPPARQLP